MPTYRQISLTLLEAKALWLLATQGARRQPPEMALDPELAKAGENAIDKVWRAEKGMPKKATPPKHPKRGAPITVGRGVQASAKL